MYEVSNDKKHCTIRIRMSGFFREEEVEQFSKEYKEATDTYNEERHLVFADMRGFKPASPPVAQKLGETIGYARQRGVLFCVHLSDSSIAKLQTARIAREASPEDDVTINVVSQEEAEKVLAELYLEYFRGEK